MTKTAATITIHVFVAAAAAMATIGLGLLLILVHRSEPAAPVVPDCAALHAEYKTAQETADLSKAQGWGNWRKLGVDADSALIRYQMNCG